MQQQHKRLLGTAGQKNCTRPELIEAYGFDTKYAAHIIRLGFQGAELLETGRISLPMREQERDLCVSIRTGKYSLAQVSNLITDAEYVIDKALETSHLPTGPDFKRVETWMLQTYLNYWNREAVL